VELFIRGIYTKPEKARVVRHPSHATILHSVWRAKDGRKAAVLVNWTKDEQPYVLECECFKSSGSLAPLSWKLEDLQ